MTIMMECGHTANAKCSQSGGVKYDPPIPSCAICSCITPAKEEIDLNNREAICAYGCKESIKPSNTNLAFFEHRPEKEYDKYYCGCYGWD